MLLLAAVLAALLPASCWDIYDTAMRHSAQAVHPRYVSYNETTEIDAHGAQLFRERALISYRDDGIALVLDDRYGQSPVVTARLDPGPPVLGPYGSSRAAWMDNDMWPGLTTIASVRVSGKETCTNAGLVNESGTPAYHLVFRRPDPKSAGLKELWVSADTGEIRRVLLTGLVEFGRGDAEPADFDLHVSQASGFTVISQITWSRAGYQGEYTFDNFAFPDRVAALDDVRPSTLPPQMFSVIDVSGAVP